jgi:hypothetical protein
MAREVGDCVNRQMGGGNPARVAYRGRRLNPQYLRTRVFARVPVHKRGLDPSDVYGFLCWVAEDLERRVSAEASLRAENEQLRAALRDRDREPQNTPR